ncbi:DUF2730 family protein [Sphingomonas paucimobilis]|jgi:hypothetical protein|uniref:DUF2730 family protein n=1 Tax=Sphingomonas paucimobilis TaxID=13689 RepID=A0A7T3E6K3_SPHPI|nr:DUF2730 family protein [Sphingomonas paucimobilis]QPT09700.1 DUF2730 family protein [Sphingomonas paucimobilis]
MNISSIWQAIGAIGVLLGIVNLLLTWLNATRQPTVQKLTELECDVEDHGKRIAKVENTIQHMPTLSDLHGVKLQLTEVIGSMRVVETELAATARTMRRVEDHLMNEKA